MIQGVDEHVECVGVGGVPAPNLLAFIGPGADYDPYLDTQLTRIDQSSTYDAETQQVSMFSLFNYQPEVSHQNYFVKCISLQSDFDNGQVVDIYEPKVCFLNQNESKEVKFS